MKGLFRCSRIPDFENVIKRWYQAKLLKTFIIFFFFTIYTQKKFKKILKYKLQIIEVHIKTGMRYAFTIVGIIKYSLQYTLYSTICKY